jgi:hypothetical protein
MQVDPPICARCWQSVIDGAYRIVEISGDPGEERETTTWYHWECLPPLEDPVTP